MADTLDAITPEEQEEFERVYDMGQEAGKAKLLMALLAEIDALEHDVQRGCLRATTPAEAFDLMRQCLEAVKLSPLWQLRTGRGQECG